MDDNILSEIKRMVGVQPEVDEFNLDILSHINGAFFRLFQLGIGPDTPFIIDADTSWDDFETVIPYEVLRDYTYLKVKLIFDPPTASNVYEAFKDRIGELEFLMNVTVDNGGGVVSG